MSVFSRLIVDYVVTGGARIEWIMGRNLTDAGPYTFQVQFSRVGLVAGEWIDVGAPVVDTYYALDLEKRLFGKEVDAFYRVKLTTADHVYYSEPTQADGKLSKRDWLYVREIIRKETLRHTVFTSVRGFLLKSRRYGPKCPDCLDEFTSEITWSNCPTCYGTGFEFGFYDPKPAAFAELGLQANRTLRDGQSGTVKQDVQKARFIGDPQLYTYDVWVNAYSDERYYLQNIETVAQHRGVNVVFSVELRLAPHTDVIYTFPIDKDMPQPVHQLSNKQEQKQWPTTINYLEAEMAAFRKRTRSSKR